MHHSSQKTDQRSQLLQASLGDQVEEARQAAADAGAARAAAEAAATAAAHELEAQQRQQEELRRAEKEAKNAGAEAQRQVQQVLADVRAGRLGAQAAEERLRAMEREAAPPEAAAMRLLGLRAAAKVREGEGGRERWQAE